MMISQLFNVKNVCKNVKKKIFIVSTLYLSITKNNHIKFEIDRTILTLINQKSFCLKWTYWQVLD